MKTVVYSATRNVYYKLVPAVKSLLDNTNVDQVYLLIEDNRFPYKFPSNVKSINISNQQWFKQDTCVNWNPGWGGYMVLIRSVYSKIFPNLDKILSLDIDTIVLKDISQLWDINLSNYYLAGVRDTPEFNARTKDKFYVNAGVLLHNLTKIHQDKLDDKMVWQLNHTKREYVQQDLFNEIYRGHILELPSIYNSNPLFMNYNPIGRKIIHYAGKHDYFFTQQIVYYYNNLNLEK